MGIYILNLINSEKKFRPRNTLREINKGNGSILDQNTFNVLKGYV